MQRPAPSPKLGTRLIPNLHEKPHKSCSATAAVPSFVRLVVTCVLLLALGRPPSASQFATHLGPECILLKGATLHDLLNDAPQLRGLLHAPGRGRSLTEVFNVLVGMCLRQGGASSHEGSSNAVSPLTCTWRTPCHDRARRPAARGLRQPRGTGLAHSQLAAPRARRKRGCTRKLRTWQLHLYTGNFPGDGLRELEVRHRQAPRVGSIGLTCRGCQRARSRQLCRRPPGGRADIFRLVVFRTAVLTPTGWSSAVPGNTNVRHKTHKSSGRQAARARA
mmetsp:Transcript_53971/g.145442  ORF Transcript_53971/g.145442 Transcript_53971/m.145442 type:complete len:277 (+) Transcript_53971:79-909(+)